MVIFHIVMLVYQRVYDGYIWIYHGYIGYIMDISYLVGGFKHEFYFPFHIYIWDVIPTPLTIRHIFQRGRVG